MLHFVFGTAHSATYSMLVFRSQARVATRAILCRACRISAIRHSRTATLGSKSKFLDSKKQRVLQEWAIKKGTGAKGQATETPKVITETAGTLGLVNDGTHTSFSALGVPQSLTRTLGSIFNATNASPCQRALLPAMLSHNDVMLKDTTGAGKTLGLVVGLLSKSHPPLLTPATVDTDTPREKPRSPHAITPLHSQRYLQTLVIVPTRELAVQITTWIRDLSPHVSPSDYSKLVQCVVSGVDEELQFNLLRSETPRIIVGTPVRLQSLYNRRAFDVSRLQTMVLDEVDRLVEARGRYDTINERFKKVVHPMAGEPLIDAILKERTAARQRATERINTGDPLLRKMQVVICSATLNNPLRRNLTLMRGWLKTPILLDLNGTSKAPSNITHRCLVVDMYGGVNPLESVQDTSSRSRPGTADPGDEVEASALPDAADEIIETISRICYEEKVQSGLVFVHTSVSMSGLVSKLNAIGLKADRILNAIDYEKSTLGGSGTAIRKAASNVSSAVSNRVTEPSPANPTTSQPESPLSSSLESLTRGESCHRPFASFLSGHTRLLTLTEWEARGLDLPSVTHVFILGPPSSPASYLHMAGRTGRYGRPGHVITLLGGRRYSSRMQGLFQLLRLPLEKATQA
ncbi:hypothetical protein SpCBS45565_g07674 [Spizellomyces sp. 'palustris']|nr:hypothetical protein SpCBS45565_g07674 [Spizellomyces sp. 'palustris']